jgi:hypothetical protein
MKSSSTAILVGVARPSMLSVAILKMSTIGLRANRGFPDVYKDAEIFVLVLVRRRA